MTASLPVQPTRRLARWTASVAVPVVLTAALLMVGAGHDEPGTARPVTTTVAAPTSFRVATFNVLGASHTGPNGDRTGYATGRQRMYGAVDLIKRSGVQMIGFQELEGVQYDTFASLMGSGWGTWPGRAIHDSWYTSVAWRKSDWTAIIRTTYETPYFEGRIRVRPLVQLRNNHTGQLVWFMNTHNPSNQTKWAGDEKVWRDASERIQAALANKLQRNNPDIPVIFTGDMNDSHDFYCPVTYLSDLESADGSTHNNLTGDAYDCTLRSPGLIDWIMGTSNIRWSGYTRWTESQTTKTSDHPYYFATANIAPQPARAAGVKRVVVVDIQGLRSGTVAGGHAPYLSRLISRGASTLQARPDDDNRRALPNTTSLLSSRRVPTSRGGHGVTTNTYAGPSVHAAAGQYVSSAFDMAHNLGMSTAFYSGDLRSRLVPRTWDSKLAGTDRYGVDNGRGKIDRRLISSTDTDATRAARTSLQDRPARLTVVQLGNVLRAGAAHGWSSPEYVRAVALADSRLRRIVGDVQGNSSSAGSTLVIVTSSAPGAPTRYGHGVPLLVWGPSVPHADLYALNRQYTRPAHTQRLPASGTPINTGVVANLVASALTLPAIPRSSLNSRLHLDVFGR